MKRFSIIFLMLFGVFYKAGANHIAGGVISYTYTGSSNGAHQYAVTVKLYRRCESDRGFENTTIVSVFSKGNNARVSDISVALSRTETLNLTNANPCITNPPQICLQVAYYNFTLSLPGTAYGYILASQVNFRVNGMNNLVPGYSQVGATYVSEIPGTVSASNGPINNSAEFTGSDLEVVCEGNNFMYSFAAQDADGDALRYTFCDAYATTGGGGGTVAPTPPPPFNAVPYGGGYNGSVPMGSDVQINTATGLITGTAPDEGIYVVAVCVQEIRNGVVIATQRKDIQVRSSGCSVAAAELFPKYQLCKDTMGIAISNLSINNLINAYNWTLLNGTGNVIYTTTNEFFNYTFEDTGTYVIKLKVATSNQCEDSTTSRILVYPGFRSGFTMSGSCFQSPFIFNDTTNATYGAVNGWLWDFGDNNTTADVAAVPATSYQYSALGNYTVSLIVANTNGCIDTVLKVAAVSDKPFLGLPFRDTLICSIDTLQLVAFGSGQFSWLPDIAIAGGNSATPLVSPDTTTTYIVTLTEESCVAKDSIKVKVLDFITVQLPPDTTICKGDSFVLQPQSEGLQYSWLPSTYLNNAAIKNPVATPLENISYTVIASLGKCHDTTSTSIKVVPYPVAYAGADTAICFAAEIQLNAAITGASFSWSPTNTLTGFTTLQPFAKPVQTTSYVLSVLDVLGCPKPAFDTVTVTVLPRVQAFAGNDTSIVLNQPLQLGASGGQVYNWSPGRGLNNTTIANPIATFSSFADSIMYVVTVTTAGGCSAKDSVIVKIFKTLPNIFVPTAFTPNGDGKNDWMRPILVGMKGLDYFKIYNRWGQLIYTTTAAGKGWDGTINGTAQRTEVFVFIAQGVDYTGKKLFKKGTFTLIR